MTEPYWTGAADRAAVQVLTAAATATDGVAPLAEQTLLTLDRGRHLLAADPAGVLLAYATPGVDGTAELVVAPSARRAGLGTAMLGALAPQAIWAHGDLPAAAALAARSGLTRGRVLRELALPLPVELPPVRWPDGVTVRTFAPGRDEGSWLALNALAFAHHPEQGRWTAADLAAREGEAWFDPAGFFLAFRGPDLVGFHWTKAEHGVGEVYVVGVDPAAAGGGLGRALTVHGLRHLAASGLPEVRLYVDDDNPRAVALYRHLGFADHHVDVAYVRPGRPVPAAPDGA